MTNREIVLSCEMKEVYDKMVFIQWSFIDHMLYARDCTKNQVIKGSQSKYGFPR